MGRDRILVSILVYYEEFHLYNWYNIEYKIDFLFYPPS